MRGAGRIVSPKLVRLVTAKNGASPVAGKKFSLVPWLYRAETPSHLNHSVERVRAVLCLRKPIFWKSSKASPRLTFRLVLPVKSISKLVLAVQSCTVPARFQLTRALTDGPKATTARPSGLQK